MKDHFEKEEVELLGLLEDFRVRNEITSIRCHGPGMPSPEFLINGIWQMSWEMPQGIQDEYWSAVTHSLTQATDLG